MWPLVTGRGQRTLAAPVQGRAICAPYFRLVTAMPQSCPGCGPERECRDVILSLGWGLHGIMDDEINDCAIIYVESIAGPYLVGEDSRT